MSLRSLDISATGMKAQQDNISNIANNIANANTTSFKKGFLSFSDLMYQTEKRMGGPVGNGSTTILPTGVQFGTGVVVDSLVKNFSQGDPIVTDVSTNIRIEGKGFFVLNSPDGDRQLYTRDGRFFVDPATNLIVNSAGYVLNPGGGITIDSANEKRIVIKRDGKVFIQLVDETLLDTGSTIELATFVNEAGLDAVGNNMYLATDASGEAQMDAPMTGNRGFLSQGQLEASNVNPITEITDLITGQRVYEMNAKVMQVSDQMMKTVTDAKS